MDVRYGWSLRKSGFGVRYLLTHVNRITLVFCATEMSTNSMLSHEWLPHASTGIIIVTRIEASQNPSKAVV
jgi:hypothetical protein